MIIGNVNAHLEAIVQLVVLDSRQQQQEIQAVIDTGYTGFLTLPPEDVTFLGLTWYARQEGILGDGSLSIFDVYEASIIWDGQTRIIEVDEAQTEPLIGMGLIEGYQLQIQGVVGGLVTITALS